MSRPMLAQVVEIAPPAQLEMRGAASPNANSVPQAVGLPNGQAGVNSQLIPQMEAIAPGQGDLQLQGASPAVDAESTFLTLADVTASVLQSFPKLQEARFLRAEARGNQVSAYGAFDTKIEAYSLAEPTGFYRNYRHGLGLSRQTWWGGYLSAGYRLGRGDFQPWYKERETNEGGEFKLAFAMPLLRGRAIDANRLSVFQAELGRMAAEPEIQRALLQATQEAAQLYWEWVASGARLSAQQELLKLAKNRQEQFEVGQQAGKFAEIDLVLNRQLVAERTSKLIAAQQKYREAGFKLSLYLRDANGQPEVPGEDWLPEHFPEIYQMTQTDLEQEVGLALTRRPELAILQLELQQIRLERQLACNDLLPSIEFYAEGSQDVGIPASSSNDKGQFELLTGFQGYMPIQRRKARGKLQSTAAKMSQINQKIRWQQDKIRVEVQTALNALLMAEAIVEQNEAALVAAFDSLARYRFAFNKGYADLIYLNLLETKAFETLVKLVDSQRDWFNALAELQASVGLDPMDQAMKLLDLPAAHYPGPGELPSDFDQVPANFDEDWELHEQRNESESSDN